MLYHNGKQVKVICGQNAFDFESKLNSTLSTFNEQGIRYELQLNPTAGLIAYIIYENNTRVPETMRDQFELVGESHTCIECPYFVRPTDGRRKYTRCSKIEGLTSATSRCCDCFYDELADGKIRLVEVG